MEILYRCDQCSHEEWREAGQEPWLCIVCGYMRWEAVAEAGSSTGEEDSEALSAEVVDEP
jgi:hypothetical protein